MDVEGRMPYSSNATFLVVVSDSDGRAAPRSHRAIYKPSRGERPLWDFPPDLFKREVATYRLAEALGWEVVPPTVIGSGPMGEGSVQAFVDADFSEHYFTMLENDVGLDDLRRLCLLDLIANNTDRKSGHCLLGRDGRIYGIDHGLSFHAQFKLRTVMWDFVGQPIPAEALAAIDHFLAEGPPSDLLYLLDSFEGDAMVSRARDLLEARIFPDDDSGGHRYPWPLV
ncbi:MAG: SCO1664 family protein [Actinomycetia bacterium]|nr:SCO1664 family protein [Actinomycetes bacterium]MCP5033704.1 SCO1664 family protein [Actinomycetes bacterium]